MMKKTILLILLSIFVVTGCRQVSTTAVNGDNDQQTAVSDVATKTYSNDLFSVDYPDDYIVNEDTFGIVTISNASGKIMIGDFEPAAVDPLPDMTQEQKDGFPKDFVYHGYYMNIASALFYKTGDTKTMEEFKKIQDSIKLK